MVQHAPKKISEEVISQQDLSCWQGHSSQLWLDKATVTNSPNTGVSKSLFLTSAVCLISKAKVLDLSSSHHKSRSHREKALLVSSDFLVTYVKYILILCVYTECPLKPKF